jgi:hypothetical protein
MYPENKGICEALTFEDGKYWCAFVKYGHILHSKVPEMISELLGIDKGCDSDY